MKNIIRSLVLIFFIFSSTTVIYGQVKKTDDVYLNSIKDYYLVDQTLVSNQGSTLVPMNAIRGVNDVYYIEYEYEVVVKKGMDLQVSIEDMFFSKTDISKDDLLNTFDFEVTKTVVEQLGYNEHVLRQSEVAERIMVHVTISMNEPSTRELMDSLVGGQLMFDVYFYAV